MSRPKPNHLRVNVSIALKPLQLRNISQFSTNDDIQEEDFIVNQKRIVFRPVGEDNLDESNVALVADNDDTNPEKQTIWEQYFAPEDLQALTFCKESIIVANDTEESSDDEDDKEGRDKSGRVEQNAEQQQINNVPEQEAAAKSIVAELQLNNAPLDFAVPDTHVDDTEDEYTDTFDDLITEDIPLGGTSKPMKKASAVQVVHAIRQKELEDSELSAENASLDEEDDESERNLPDMAIQKVKSNLWRIEKSYSYLNRIHNKTDTKVITKMLDLSTIISRKDIWRKVYAVYTKGDSKYSNGSQPNQTFYIEFVMNNLQWTPQPRAELVFRMQLRVESVDEIFDELSPSEIQDVSVDQIASANISSWNQSVDPRFFWKLVRPYQQLQHTQRQLEQQLNEREIKIAQLPAPPFISLPGYSQQSINEGVPQGPRSPTMERPTSDEAHHEYAKGELDQLETTSQNLDQYLTLFTRRILLNDRWMPHVGRLIRSHIIPHTIEFMSHKLRVKPLYGGNCFLWSEVIVGMSTGSMSPAPVNDAQLESYWESASQQKSRASSRASSQGPRSAMLNDTLNPERAELDESAVRFSALQKLVGHVQQEKSKDDHEKMTTFLIYAINVQMLHKWIEDLYFRESVQHMYENGALVKQPFAFGKFMSMMSELSQMPWRIRQQENEE